MQIICYATNKNGEGRVKEIGRYDEIDEIEIVVGMFSKDVVITFELETICKQ